MRTDLDRVDDQAGNGDVSHAGDCVGGECGRARGCDRLAGGRGLNDSWRRSEGAASGRSRAGDSHLRVEDLAVQQPTPPSALSPSSTLPPTCARLSLTPTPPSTPFSPTSNYGSPRKEQAGPPAGVRDVLGRPADPAEAQGRRLRPALGRQEAQARARRQEGPQGARRGGQAGCEGQGQGKGRGRAVSPVAPGVEEGEGGSTASACASPRPTLSFAALCFGVLADLCSFLGLPSLSDDLEGFSGDEGDDVADEDQFGLAGGCVPAPLALLAVLPCQPQACAPTDARSCS